MSRSAVTRRLATAATAAMLAAALAGCAGSGVNAPPGPPTGTIRPAPPSTAASGDAAHAGTKEVTPAARKAIAAALQADGIEVGNASALTMTYSTDRQQVIVTGTGMRTSSTATQTARTVQRVQLEQAQGTWRVLNVAGRQ